MKSVKERTDLEWFENWMEDAVNIRDNEGENVVDLVFEFLQDQMMLTEEGRKLAKEFWKKHVRSNHENNQTKEAV
jgi:hypothetical protein